MNDLGYIDLDRRTLQAAEQAREADLVSGVVRHAEVLTAAERVRARLAREQSERPVVLSWRTR